MYPGLSIEEVKLPDDEAGLHLGLYNEGQLCSVISLFQNEGLQFRKFATVQAVQGRGFGSYLLEYVFDYAKQKGIKRIWCNARTTAVGLYERFGMQPFGDTWEQLGHRFVKIHIAAPG